MIAPFGSFKRTSPATKHRMPFHGTRDSGRRASDVVLVGSKNSCGLPVVVVHEKSA